MKKKFLIDTHMHTAEISSCGRIPAAELALRCRSHGYDSIVITDHLNQEFLSRLPFNDDWDKIIDHFLSGYKTAKKQGEEIGLNVLLGAEIQFTINENDYLIYGIDEDFLRSNPFLHLLSPWEFFDKFGNEILIIQAHPFRDGNETVFPECIHGVEVYNGNPRHNNYDHKALDLCAANPQFYRLHGSDIHCDGDFGRAWMLFDEEIPDSHSFHAAIKQNEYSMGHP